MLINVLDNSIEAMADGGKISVISKTDVEQEKLVIEISDTGEGIPEKIINKIFEPFFTSKESGVGLGLAISYQIVKAHNGEIFFSKNIEKGTNCTIKIPLQQ